MEYALELGIGILIILSACYFLDGDKDINRPRGWGVGRYKEEKYGSDRDVQ